MKLPSETLQNLTYFWNTKIHVVLHRVVYDRVRKRKNYFEIPTFLQIEGGKSRAGKLILNFPLLIFLIQSEEKREFQNNFSFSVPYHIVYNPGNTHICCLGHAWMVVVLWIGTLRFIQITCLGGPSITYLLSFLTI